MARKYLKRGLNKSNDKQSVKNAKPASSSNIIKEFPWINEHILPVIIDYLSPKEKIQLSSSSKLLRLRLESSIFRKIKLLPNNYLDNPTQYGENLNIRGIQSKLCSQAIETLGDKAHLIKEITIDQEINTKFGKAFFKIFHHIKKLKVDNTSLKLSTLIDILMFLKELEYLHLDSYRLWFDISQGHVKMNCRLPPTIKTVIANVFSSRGPGVNPILRIDHTHSDLQSISLVNPEMFIHFKNTHPSLVDLDILNYDLPDIDSIKDILIINPQITKLTMNGECMTESLLNTILSLSNLITVKLSIIERGEEYNFSKLIHNWSITTIEIINKFSDRFIPLILDSCKNLQTLKLSHSGFKVSSFNWKDYRVGLKYGSF